MKTTRPNIAPRIADRYAEPDEMIVEFSSGAPNGPGGLLSMRRQEDGALNMHLYRTDPGVHVFVENRHNVTRAITVSDGVTLDVQMRYTAPSPSPSPRLRRATAADSSTGEVWAVVYDNGDVDWSESIAATVTALTRNRVEAYLSGMLGIPAR
jgi:hypothetical protein